MNEVSAGDTGRVMICIEAMIDAISSFLLSRHLHWDSLSVFEECMTVKYPNNYCVP